MKKPRIKLCLNVSRRNTKHLPLMYEVMGEYNMSMTETFFTLLTEKHQEIQDKQTRKELLGICK